MVTTITPEGYGFLNALAVGESNGDYTILYGGGHFTGFTHFPQWSGKDNSHAAGKYQFEPKTWSWVAGTLGLKDFTPQSQDEGAWWLAQTIYEHVLGRTLQADLLANDTSHVASALHSTWTSLNPATFPARYKAALVKPTPTPVTESETIWQRLGNLLGLGH